MLRVNRVLAGSAALALFLSILITPAATGQGAPPKIGVINVKLVFQAYQKAKDFEDHLEAEAKGEKEYMEKVEKDLKDLREEIDLLDPTSDLRKQKVEKFVQLQSLAKFRVEEWNNRTKMRLNENTAILFNEIRAEIVKFSEEAGYDLILKTETPDLDPKSKESANQRVNRRTVLFHSKSLDVTETITKRLNDSYAKTKGPGGNAGAGS